MPFAAPQYEAKRWIEPMTAKESLYRARAKKCEELAKATRGHDRRERQMTLARAYQMLALAEGDAETRRLLMAA
jgi:hypothetical protein